MSHRLETTVRTLLERQTGENPDRLFALFPETGKSLSFSGLHANSRRLCALLARRQIGAGERVAFLMPNGFQGVNLFVGILSSGAVAVPLSLLAQPAQLAHVLQHSDARLIFVASHLAGKLNEALNALTRPVQVIELDPDSPAPWDVDQPDDVFSDSWPGPALADENDALQMYTSGTTGLPKGVVLSQANVVAGARFVSEAHALRMHDRVLAVLPLYHINAQVVTVLAPLFHGGSLVMPSRFSVHDFWQQAISHGCTWLNVVPTIISYLLASDSDPLSLGAHVSRIHFCRSASAPLPPDQQRAFEARFGIGVIETMGLTETAAPCFTNPLPPSERRIGSPGKPWGNEARIASPDTNEPLSDGQTGEIQIRGPNVMKGYYRAADETARSFTPDGWLRTGDLGYRDRDGYYFVTGRIKELIIKGGENIAPREIDEALLRHPAVLEAAAFAVHDVHYGQDIEAGVVLQPGISCDEISLQNFCRQELGAFKTPRAIHFLGDLPKGPSGKVQRLRLLSLLP